MTIVAAWMRAETGVGPAIASGSQTYSGTCALLPMAPTKRQRQMIDSAGAYRPGSVAAFPKTSEKLSEPKAVKMPNMPSRKP